MHVFIVWKVWSPHPLTINGIIDTSNGSIESHVQTFSKRLWYRVVTVSKAQMSAGELEIIVLIPVTQR